MSEAAIIAQLLFHAVLLGALGQPEVGVGAFYHERPGQMREICEYRVQQGWTPGLQCDWPCLVSAIEPEDIGQMWLVYHDTLGYNLCHTVDVGAKRHLPALRVRGEVVELSWAMAQAANWTGYTPNVKVWRLNNGR